MKIKNRQPAGSTSAPKGGNNMSFDATKAKAVKSDTLQAALTCDGSDPMLWKLGISPIEGAPRPTGKRTVAGVIGTHLPYLMNKKGVSAAVIEQALANLDKAVQAAKAARTPGKVTPVAASTAA